MKVSERRLGQQLFCERGFLYDFPKWLLRLFHYRRIHSHSCTICRTLHGSLKGIHELKLGWEGWRHKVHWFQATKWWILTTYKSLCLQSQRGEIWDVPARLQDLIQILYWDPLYLCKLSFISTLLKYDNAILLVKKENDFIVYLQFTDSTQQLQIWLFNCTVGLQNMI